MKIGTGITAYEQFLSLDADNNPITGTTFDIAIYKDSDLYTGITVSTSLTDGSRGVFTASWSADTTGYYQFYIKNNITNVIFISDSVSVLPDSAFDENIFIGL